MEKTIEILLADQRQAIYKQLLVASNKTYKDEHPGWCASTNSPEDACDCLISTLLEIVKGQ